MTNSFLLTGTGEEDKQFHDEAIEIEMKPSRIRATERERQA